MGRPRAREPELQPERNWRREPMTGGELIRRILFVCDRGCDEGTTFDADHELVCAACGGPSHGVLGDG